MTIPFPIGALPSLILLERSNSEAWVLAPECCFLELVFQISFTLIILMVVDVANVVRQCPRLGVWSFQAPALKSVSPVRRWIPHGKSVIALICLFSYFMV